MQYYPPPGFYFGVQLLGSQTVPANFTGVDACFQEASGLTAELEVEEVVEGGENRYVHRLPRVGKSGPLILRRGIVTCASPLAEWVGNTIGSGLQTAIQPQNLLVCLFDPQGNPSVAWFCVNAWPRRWETGPLDAQESKVLIETMEFIYSYFDRTVLGSGGGSALNQAASRYMS